MVDRRVVQPTGLQLSSLAQPHITEVASPQSSHMAPAEPGAHESARPAVLLDEQSAATDPFFDFSGKPISYLNVGIGGGRGIDGEQFDTRVPGTVGQSSPAEDDKIVSSGADFHAASVDALIGSAPPLGLLGQEGRGGLGNSLADANGAGQAHHNVSAAVVVAPGSVVIPGPGGPATMVFEAGLGARPGEPAGSHPGQASFPVTTKVGTISFTSPDGVQTVSLGGHALTGTSQTFTDAIGSLTASFAFNAATGKGTITYSYTLLDNTLGVPNANFAVVITDRDGDSNPPADLVIKIVDDAPIARADGDTIAPGQTTADGNVLTGAGTTAGAGTADVSGADGGLQVVGVAAGNGPGGAAPGTVGVAIAGAFGTLTLNADGSYTYVHTAGGGTETFTYTIRDADGSLAHATLTISLGDAAPNNFNIPAAGGAATTVFEAGLSARAGEPAGSHSGDPTFPTTTQSGTITFTSMDGVDSITVNGHTITGGNTPLTFTDTTGSMTISYSWDLATGNGRINYSYALLDNGGASDAPFHIAVTDFDGDTTDVGNFLIGIVDDGSLARPDADTVGARQNTAETGNVITGEGTASGSTGADLGADGLVVVGYAAGVTNFDNTTTLGIAVAGEGGRGILTMFADGSYSFSPSGLPPGGASTFTYTIRDISSPPGEGLSHATITFTRDDLGGSIVATTEAPDGTSANHFIFNAPSDGGAHILDFRSGHDSIDVLLSSFTGLSGKGSVASSDFVTSNNASTVDMGKAHFAYNAASGELFYDSNGGDASGASRILLAVLDHHAAISATDIHKI